MKFNKHFGLEGKHAYLGASKYSWLNYSDEKFIETYNNHLAKMRGTQLHELAAKLIEVKQPLPRKNLTLNMYVNDAIKFNMQPEQLLFYSNNCFGTADAICFDGNLLRIHDLKTGITPAHMQQLEIYAALFCLEYDVRPGDIDYELRIYQCDEIIAGKPNHEIIAPIMDKIYRFDSIMTEINEGVEH